MMNENETLSLKRKWFKEKLNDVVNHEKNETNEKEIVAKSVGTKLRLESEAKVKLIKKRTIFISRVKTCQIRKKVGGAVLSGKNCY